MCSAPVARMASSKAGQSTWSEKTKPRSTARRRRVPRIVIQPEARAVDAGPNLRVHGVPRADGGGMIRARPQSPSCRPTVNRQTEGRFGYKRVAADRLKGSAGNVMLGLVVSGDDPDFAAPLDTNLRRTEDVPGRVKRYAHPVQDQRLAIGDRLDRRIG